MLVLLGSLGGENNDFVHFISVNKMFSAFFLFLELYNLRCFRFIMHQFVSFKKAMTAQAKPAVEDEDNVTVVENQYEEEETIDTVLGKIKLSSKLSCVKKGVLIIVN